MEKYLEVVYSNQKSFYNKAITRADKSEFGTYHTLFSYGVFIAEIKEFVTGEKIINALTENEKHLTITTVKHLNEFMLQHELENKSKKEWIESLDRINYAY